MQMIAAMIVFGLALVVPRLGHMVETVLLPLTQASDGVASRLPASGIAGAAGTGALLAVAWAPCVGPSLGAAIALAVLSSVAAAGDRFYYLSRTQGMNMLNELENNTFTKLVMRNTDLGDTGMPHLPGILFDTANHILEMDQSLQFTPDPEWDDPVLNSITPMTVLRARASICSPSAPNSPSGAPTPARRSSNRERWRKHAHTHAVICPCSVMMWRHPLLIWATSLKCWPA